MLMDYTTHSGKWISRTYRRERNGRSQFFSAYHCEVPKTAQCKYQRGGIPTNKFVNDFDPYLIY